MFNKNGASGEFGTVLIQVIAPLDLVAYAWWVSGHCYSQPPKKTAEKS
jgi:hypothetical protein